MRFGSTAQTATPLAAQTITLGGGIYPAAPACFSKAQKTIRYGADGSLHLDAVAVDPNPAAAGLAAWDDIGERFIAWHCVVTPRADGHWPGRVTVVTSDWTIGSGGDRRVCRYGSVGAIDANIAHPGEYADVDRALVAQNFLVVPGGESCPRDPPTEQHQP